MRHLDAVKHLGEFGGGTLSAETERAVASHLQRCPRCRSWIGTRDLLAASLADAGDHPTSDVLARYAVGSRGEPDDDVREHLTRCTTCRGDVALVRSALRQVPEAAPNGDRPGGDRGDIPGSPPRIPGSPPRGSSWLAAAVLILLLAGGFFGAAILVVPLQSDTTPRPVRTAGIGVHAEPPARPLEELTGRELSGTQLIEGEAGVVLSKVTVTEGADITVRSDRLVVLGDGFRVASGGRLSVGTRSSAQGDSPPAQAPAHRSRIE